MQTIFSKLNKLILVCSFLTVVLMLTDSVPAQESTKTKTLVVIGTATVQESNISGAREKAISDALITAVALMTEELLQVQSFVDKFAQINELLFEQTSNFIRDYKVLTEAAKDKTYHVVVQATVAGDKISKQLSDAGILRVETPLPSILLLIAEKSSEESPPRFWWSPEGASYTSVSGTMMAERLQEAGFVIIDHRGIQNQSMVDRNIYNKPNLTNQEAVQLGALLKADVTVLGTSTASPSTNTMGSAMKSFNGTVSGSVIRTNSSETMLSFTRTVVAVHEDDIIGSREALKDAGDRAGASLAEELVAAWQKHAGKPSVVEVIIRGTGHLASYVKFRKILNTISGVEGIRVKEIKPNEAALWVEYKGKTKDLAAALMLQNFESFGINIFEVTPEKLQVELIPG